MTPDRIQKAIELQERGSIERVLDAYLVPSHGSKKRYCTTALGCSCDARGVCCHQLATVFLPALLAIQATRWATTEHALQAVREIYEDRKSVV